MEAALKKEYILENLCCGHCAAQIEREAGDLEGVCASSVDFVNKTLRLEFGSAQPPQGLFEAVESIAKRHDSDIVLKEKESAVPGKKTLYLHGLDCAGCAHKIEEATARLDGVKSVVVDFAAQRLTVEAADKKDLPGVLRAVTQTVQAAEPDVRVSYRADDTEKPGAGLRGRLKAIGLIAGVALFAVGMVFPFPRPVELLIFIASYLAVGGEIVFKALRNIARGQVFDENFLMSVASIGAFFIGEYPEGVAVMLFYQVGELLQGYAVNRSRRSITALLNIRPDYANLKTDGGILRVSPEEVGVGDLIVVKPGEKVPLDGVVTEGVSSLDTSALTGESLPRDIAAGGEALSGSVNQSGFLTVRVTKEFGESTVSKILELVQSASGQKAPTENFITKFARYYTPVVVLAALLIAMVPPLFIPGATFATWVGRGLAYLVVSCPCALVISIPLSFFGGIGGASKSGILVKGSNYLEALNNVNTVVFDKTGTLTKGSFNVTEIRPAGGFSEQELLTLAAHAEHYSNHPIAVSIRAAYGKAPDESRIAAYEEIAGYGVRVQVDGKAVLAGNEKLMRQQGIGAQPAGGGTVVYLAADGVFAGAIVIADEIKADSRRAVERLKAAGVKKIVMLTGDSRAAGEQVARALELDEAVTDMLPQQKVERMEALSREISRGGKLVYVGDGINDAPVLALADVGVAMGGVGSDAAIEAADVVLMTDEPSKLADAIAIARKTRRIVLQNIIFALGVKVIIMVLVTMGMATMWEAVFGDVGVALIAVINATRAMRVKKAPDRI